MVAARGFHDLRGRRKPPQKHHVHGDEEHHDNRGGHTDVLLPRVVGLLLYGRRILTDDHIADGAGNAGEEAYFCGDGYGVPWDGSMGPNLGDNISGVFWAAFVLFSWTTGSIMSGAVLERIRISAYLWLTALMGGLVWVVAAAWGWSYGGWMTIHFGYHDFAASGVVHGIAGIFALGILFNLGPRLGRYDRNGGTRAFKPHNLHLTLMGLMIIFTAFYAFYAACLAITADTDAVWMGQHLLQPSDTVGDHLHDHDGLRRRFRRRVHLRQG